MLLLLLLLIFVIVSNIVAKKARWYSTTEQIAELSFVVSAMTMAIVALIGLTTYIDTSQLSARREAIQTTVENVKSTSNYEAVTTATKVFEFNEHLAEAKYWRKSIWVGSFISFSVEDLEPVEY